MPEGPEVAVLARQIGEIVTGKLTSNVKSKKFREAASVFEDNTVKLVKSHGKLLIFEFEDGRFVTSHLALSGHWYVSDLSSKTYPRPESEKFSFECEKRLFCYEDSRSLGKLTTANDWSNPETLDVLSCTPESVFDVLNSHKRAAIANALINQQYIAGIGNYLRADILYQAGVYPKKKISELSESEMRKISVACIEVPRDSYKKGGSVNYSDLYREKGGYESPVYQKNTDPNGSPVEKLKIGGRTVYYSPEQQKESNY